MFKIGIIGAGWIAHKMAKTISSLDNFCVYAIASRSQQKADDFAKEWNIKKAYGNYGLLFEDEDVDLVYIATPHSFHFEQAMMAIKHNKPVLVEKAFTANAKQAID